MECLEFRVLLHNNDFGVLFKHYHLSITKCYTFQTLYALFDRRGQEEPQVGQ